MATKNNVCSKCGRWMPVCKCDGSRSPYIHTFKPMVYNDICETPILIESKKQLREECKKHNVQAVRLM